MKERSQFSHQEPVTDPVSGIPLPIFLKTILVTPDDVSLRRLMRQELLPKLESSKRDTPQAKKEGSIPSFGILFEDCVFDDRQLSDVTEEIDSLDPNRVSTLDRTGLPPCQSVRRETED